MEGAQKRGMHPPFYFFMDCALFRAYFGKLWQWGGSWQSPKQPKTGPHSCGFKLQTLFEMGDGLIIQLCMVCVLALCFVLCLLWQSLAMAGTLAEPKTAQNKLQTLFEMGDGLIIQLCMFCVFELCFVVCFKQLKTGPTVVTSSCKFCLKWEMT